MNIVKKLTGELLWWAIALLGSSVYVGIVASAATWLNGLVTG